MHGAIIGDIVGSIYEFDNIKSKRKNSRFFPITVISPTIQ